MNTSHIILTFIIGSIGVGYIIYGRKQMHSMALISGLLLCIFPIFVSNTWLTLLIAAGLMVLPRFIDA